MSEPHPHPWHRECGDPRPRSALMQAGKGWAPLQCRMMGKRQRSRQERDPPPPPKAGRSGSGRALGLLAVVFAAAAGAWLLLRFRPAHPTLLLVTIDTLRADHVGAYGYGLGSTPVLDGLARRGARFEHAESAVPLTGPSHSTILTGLYPPAHGVRDNVNFVLEPGHPTLATRLKRLGYPTTPFVGAYPGAASPAFPQRF